MGSGYYGTTLGILSSKCKYWMPWITVQQACVYIEPCHAFSPNMVMLFLLQLLVLKHLVNKLVEGHHQVPVVLDHHLVQGTGTNIMEETL